MRIKKAYYFTIMAVLLVATSCKKSFVHIEPKGEFLSDNYYANQEQAFAALVATYDVMRKNSGGFENMLALLNAGSDDHFAGGGNATDGNQLQVFSNYTITPNSVAGSYWNDHYQGVFRANVVLSKLPGVPMDDNTKARFAAEAKALRALYYFNLVRLFRNIPLLLEPLTATNIYDVTQAKPEEVYAQIEKDLSEAAAVLPTTLSPGELGRFTKGAAKALLGKVYLYEKKNTEAAAQLAEVNGTPGGTSAYGYKLLDNFADLWVATNKFHTESILEVSHTNLGRSTWGNWGSASDEGNTFAQMVGPRSYQKKTPTAPDIYPAGWSFSVVTQDLYDFLQGDPRFAATIFDAAALKAANEIDYTEGYMNTGYFLKKYLPRASDVTTLGGNTELNFAQNSYIIRLADTYLMEAEALGATGPRAQALLDAVRARVGLSPVPVSLQAIKNERRAELAGEGHRWFDLVRWGDAATVLASRGFKAGTHDILPIPSRELQGTKLIQNPGYNK
ncbi:MAG TPA: RagB/SusD family nutrient uptake outer membrane protein [Chitinophagaceae bacterium]|nr:RagB/SusD family nutrient uptake outer membrane protein [Chitinophagaceae bacterium]